MARHTISPHLVHAIGKALVAAELEAPGRKTRKSKDVTVAPQSRDWFMTDKHVRVNLLKDAKGVWRVTVWGPDDSGMELVGDLDRCLQMFNAVRDGVTREQLLRLGFTRA